MGSQAGENTKHMTSVDYTLLKKHKTEMDLAKLIQATLQ